MMRSTKLEHTMGVAMTRLLLYHFVGFAHNAMANVDGRSGSAAGEEEEEEETLFVNGMVTVGAV